MKPASIYFWNMGISCLLNKQRCEIQCGACRSHWVEYVPRIRTPSVLCKFCGQTNHLPIAFDGIECYLIDDNQRELQPNIRFPPMDIVNVTMACSGTFIGYDNDK